MRQHSTLNPRPRGIRHDRGDASGHLEAGPFDRHGKNCPIILPHDPRRPTTMEAMPPAISPADDGHPHTEDLEQFSTK